MPTPRASDGEKGDPNQRGSSGDLMLPSAVAQLLPTPTTSDNGPGAHGDGGTDLRTTVARMLPTPTSRDWKDHTIRREPHRPDDVDTLARALTDVPCALAQRLLPTPTASDVAKGGPQHPNKRRAGGHQPTIMDVAEHVLVERLLPTPGGYQGERGGSQHPDKLRAAGHSVHIGDVVEQELRTASSWGDYAAAIHRWEQILGRPAPAPTMTSAKGNPQLSPRFVEWMQGLPEGWVDDVPDLTRNEKLKALGNGVVSQQAVEAVLRLLTIGVPA